MQPNEEGKKLTGKQLIDVIEKTCKEGTIVNTDEFKSYGILDCKEQKEKYTHVTVNHSKGQYYAGNGIHTNGIDNFWGVMKNGIRGTYHHISGQHMQKYIDDFAFRQNTRLDKNMFDILLKQCISPQKA